jgi:CheY-like chemotaxis protein
MASQGKDSVCKSRVLFVDDNWMISETVSADLRDCGYDVVEASSSFAAVAVIDQHEPLCALVSDIDLGEGLDGFAVARYARSAYPRLLVVYMSGRNEERHLVEGVPRSTFIHKPFAAEQIAEALANAIRLEAA